MIEADSFSGRPNIEQRQTTADSIREKGNGVGGRIDGCAAGFQAEEGLVDISFG